MIKLKKSTSKQVETFSRFQHFGGRGGACAGVEILRTKKEESGILLHPHFSTAPVIPKI